MKTSLKIRKIALGLMAFTVLLTLNPVTSNASTEVKQNIVATNNTINQEEANALMIRLSEINELDKAGMSSLEKKELRNEVVSIKNQLFSNPVIYISGGALLLIIILLIILL